MLWNAQLCPPKHLMQNALSWSMFYVWIACNFSNCNIPQPIWHVLVLKYDLKSAASFLSFKKSYWQTVYVEVQYTQLVLSPVAPAGNYRNYDSPSVCPSIRLSQTLFNSKITSLRLHIESPNLFHRCIPARPKSSLWPWPAFKITLYSQPVDLQSFTMFFNSTLLFHNYINVILLFTVKYCTNGVNGNIL